MRLTLRRDVSLAVLAQARTEADHHEDLGCSILGPASRPVRRAHLALKKQVHALGADESLKLAPKLVRWLEDTTAYRALTRGKQRRGGRALLRDDFLFFDTEKHRPRVLHLRRESLGLDVPVRASQWPLYNEFFTALARGATRSELQAMLPELFETLHRAKWLERFEPPVIAPAPGVVFIGHNTTLITSKTTRVLVDPYFRPASMLDLPSYQPMQPRDVGPVDAVMITHSHGDHFHLGSLLQLSRNTPVFVPPVERETLFSTDCARRLQQLGFTRVEALPWFESRRIGDLELRALPFYGEQPTSREGVYPGLFNIGSTWAVKGPGVSCAFFADAGSDLRGSMRAVCKKVAPVDILFCGVRGFRVKPIFFSFTTLDAYLVNVPLADLTAPQQLMADAAEALEYGRLLRAKHVVPCADGGAPWYWREGMGPRYAGYPGVPVEGASTHDENADADPFPEVLSALAPSRALLLRPGDRWNEKLTRQAPFQWPGWVSEEAKPRAGLALAANLGAGVGFGS